MSFFLVQDLQNVSCLNGGTGWRYILEVLLSFNSLFLCKCFRLECYNIVVSILSVFVLAVICTEGIILGGKRRRRYRFLICSVLAIIFMLRNLINLYSVVLNLISYYFVDRSLEIEIKFLIILGIYKIFFSVMCSSSVVCSITDLFLIISYVVSFLIINVG